MTEYGDGVGVVVVSYSPGETLESFLSSIPAATTGSPEVVISDNGSTDGAPQAALERHPGTRLLVDESNPGYGTAANAGAALFSPAVGWVLVCNPDLTFTPGAIDALVAAARRRPDVGTAGPVIRTPDGEKYPSARELPSLRNGIGHALFARVWPENPWSRRYRRELDVQSASTEFTAGWLSGACLLVRREVWDRVGGFDPGYHMYFEDVDLGLRVGALGYVNLFVPGSEVIHIGGVTTSRYSDRMLRAHHTSAYRYLAKKYRGVALWPLRVVLRIGLRARMELGVSAARRARRGQR